MKDAIADTAETKHEMSAAFQKFGKNRNRVKIATESKTMHDVIENRFAVKCEVNPLEIMSLSFCLDNLCTGGS